MGNWDFDGDEIAFFFLAGIAAIAGLARWYYRIFRSSTLRSSRVRSILALAPLVSSAGLIFVLLRWADPKYVVGQLDYQLLFFAGGLAWIWIAAWMTRLFGIDLATDVLENTNASAAVVIFGAITGAMCVYAGSNVGSGPTIWTTIVPAIVATATWLAAWFVVELITRTSESITVDRDMASGIRLAGFLIASGLILGRAMAGDWTSWDETFHTFIRLSWPVVPLIVPAIILHYALRPTPQNPAPTIFMFGWIPTFVIVAPAIAYLLILGPADIGKHIITYEEYTHTK